MSYALRAERPADPAFEQIRVLLQRYYNPATPHDRERLREELDSLIEQYHRQTGQRIVY